MPLRINKIYLLVYHTICYFVFRSVGPLVILILLNSSLAVALRLVHSRRRQITSASGRGRGSDGRHENLTLMLVVVVTVFVVCEIPDVCLRLMVVAFEFEDRMSLNTSTVRYALVVCNALHALNSSVNFIIYCLLGCRFRRILLRRLTDVCRRRSTVADYRGTAVECRRLAVRNNNSEGVVELPVPNPLTSQTRQLDYGTATVHACINQLQENINMLQITRTVDESVQLRIERTVVVLRRPLGDGVSV